MDVYPDRMRENLDSSFGLVFSQPCSSRSSSAGSPATTPTGSCSGPRRGPGRSAAPFRDVLRDDPDVTAALDGRRARRRASTSTARSSTPAARSTALDATDESARVTRLALPHHYTGKVRDLYEVGHDRMLIVASDRISVFDVVLDDRSPTRGGC